MLRQTAKQRLQSRIVLYSSVIALVWVMQKMNEAYEAEPVEEPAGVELVAFQLSK